MQERNVSLDILRIFACMGVIMIHAAGSPEHHHWIEVGTTEWNCCAALDALSRWSVPVFAMLSGFLFLNPQKELPLSKLYGKYIARIVVALIFWSLFYAFTLHSAYYPFGIQEGHFWYLGMCIGLYMAMPIMRYIAQDKSLLSYFCWAWLGCKVYFFLGNYITLPFDLSHLLFVDYVGYCLWAYYLSSIVLERKYEYMLYGLGILGMAICVSGYIITKDPDSFYGSYVSATSIATSFSLFYLCSHHKFDGGKSINKVIQTISECTFGIYLVHMWMLIQVIFRVHRFVSNSVYTVLISAGMAFIGGLIVTYMLKKIPLVKKWIV